MDTLEKKLAFLLTLDRLKEVQRRSYTLAGRRENSAEHSWHVAVSALLLASEAPAPLDVSKVVAMLLIHDVVEIEAGDTYAYDTAASLHQLEREAQAAESLFSQLPAEQETTWRKLWWEFATGDTAEARFARSLDRFLPVLLNVATGGRSWREHGVNASQVLARNGEVASGCPALWQKLQELVRQAVEKGALLPAPQGAGDFPQGGK
jgi:putative hydrolase of HD superfamily